MTFPLASAPPITGAFAFREYPGFGILGADIPTTGDSGRSPAINDGISPDAEYHWRIETPPSAGALLIFPDISFDYDAAGVPDGSYPWVYRLFETGVDQGTATVTQTVGNIASLVTVANSRQSNTASAAAIKQTHLVQVANSTQSNAGSGVSAGQSGVTAVLIANNRQANQSSAAAIEQTHLVRAAASQQANTASPTSIKQTHLVRASASTQTNRASAVAIHVGLPNPDQPGAFATNVVRKTRFDCKIQRKVIFTLGVANRVR